MQISSLRRLVAPSLLAILCVGFPPLRSSDEPADVKVLVERVERVSHDEAHFWLRLENTSSRPVFFGGINYESAPLPYPVFLEQWRPVEGWKVVAPCLDTQPPDVIKLNSGGGIRLDLVLKVPLSGVCKERNIKLEGTFRYRLDYFESEKEARTYWETYFSSRYHPVHAVAFSESFEIPPAH